MRLYRRLDERHSISISRNFPKKISPVIAHRHRVILGVGGNIGDTIRRIEHLWIHLSRLSQVRRIQSGVILRNPPFGFIDQDYFENTVIEISTSLSPRAFLRLIWRIENRFGRRRSFLNAPRTLDLDILFFGKRRVNYPELIIPHPHWNKRLSVTIPLGSMSKKGKTVRRYYENLNI